MSEINQSDHIIETGDGFPLQATIFKQSEPSDKVIVIASGLGVPRYAYYKFAIYWATNGYVAITFDCRGIYESTDPHFSPAQMRLEEWGRRDVEAVLQHAIYTYPSAKIYYAGHSAGGQLIGLAPSSLHISGAILISITLGHWRYWPHPWKWGAFVFWKLVALLSHNSDHFPARMIGFSSIDIPGGVARQWGEWGKSRNYLFDHITPQQLSRYKNLRMPLLSLSFSDDQKMGPKAAVDAILLYYAGVDLTRWHLHPKDYNVSSINHFGFFKDTFKKSLWPEVRQWLEQQ